jgi:hypothetical protein
MKDRKSEIVPLAVEIRFDLPYSLGVEGDFTVRATGEVFDVSLATQIEDNPSFPGAAAVKNIAILEDDSNTLAHTKVIARYTPQNPSDLSDYATFSKRVACVALSIANVLVTGVRLAFSDYIKDYLYLPKRLGPIDFTVPSIEGRRGYVGWYDPLMGGITIATPPRTGSAAAEFGRIVAAGEALPVSKELYFEARRYLTLGNNRMALANLVISFEVGLADSLAKIAVARGDSSLEAKILDATIAALGQNFAKQTLGHSFDDRSFWGARFNDAYEWLRVARNEVLHKAHLVATRGTDTRDFSNASTLKGLFSEHDWLRSEIDRAVPNVIAGKPAK